MRMTSEGPRLARRRALGLLRGARAVGVARRAESVTRRRVGPVALVAFIGGIVAVLAWRRMMAAADAALDALLPPRRR